ncbi:MFS transporter [Rhizobium leguminosarum]|uniref:MFS transporter n=1 Tax=Rhizobium leguminosarum TaxID=384 RepID=UPI001C926410|nr:MFS transporter [Rhizobium leguminosarum]MBY2919791.1 MFS transporter [Rhizobium leguminosarum]MBY2975506.1 MFS transporter [Rhizobium leguminosarum]MBY2982441.1 MFS transporter [Rhizobium leguminosarum]MBY2993633.1 MFS transporter [Rhizobium leguminosarum]MBY3011424.1 MFS transporter [Rhizobium leguminosarum]
MDKNVEPAEASGVSPFRVPSFGPVFFAILLAMLAEAMAGSYIALLGVQEIGMSPLELGAFLTIPAATGVAITSFFGHLLDRQAVIWPLLVSLLSKCIGFALCAYLTETWMLIMNAGILFGLGAASFSILFAVAKGRLDEVGGSTVSRGMAILRLVASLSWTIGPALGAVLVSQAGFPSVFVGAASLAGLALAIVFFTRIRSIINAEERPALTWSILHRAAPAALALSAFHTAMFMGSNAMSIVVARDLGTEEDVGLLFSLCAGLEVVFMAAFVVWPKLSNRQGLLLVGFALFAAYFVMALVWPTLMSLYFGQIPRAAGIGIISIVGMAFIQDLLPGRAGVASALFGNTISVGFLLSGLGTGLWANAFGYWSLFFLCAALCGFGAVTLAIRRRTLIERTV